MLPYQLTTMNFQQLRYILAVHEHKHFGNAAAACHVSQASLSAMIRKFEQEHNLVLFDRSHQPIQTTSCGNDAIIKIKEVLAKVEELQLCLEKAETVMKGALKIGIIPTVASGLIPLIYERLETQLADIQFQFINLKTEQIWAALKAEEIDAGIVATPTESNEFQEYLLYYESLKIYGKPSDHQTVYELPLKLEDPTMWLLEEGHCLSGQAKRICTLQNAKASASNLRVGADSLDILIHLVDRKGGFTIVPELYVNQLPEARLSDVHHFKAPIPVREVNLVTWRARSKYRLVKGLQDLIQREIQPILQTAALQNSQMQVLDL